MVTRMLLALIALLLAAGSWRLARWHWRPRLVLPDAVDLVNSPDGIRVFLDVRNEGAGRSRSCRAVLIRCERLEAAGWLRVEPPHSAGAGDRNAHEACIPSHGSTRIELDHVVPDGPGTYRLEIAILNGEEKRSSYVVDMEAVAPGAST
jgi:hypothetical protein